MPKSNDTVFQILDTCVYYQKRRNVFILRYFLDWESAYVSKGVCWPHGPPLYFGFLLPVGLIILFNITIFVIILRSLAKDRQKVRYIPQCVDI